MLAVLGLIAFTHPISAQSDAGAPVTLSDTEKEEFLTHADVVAMRGVATGVTGTKRVTLSDGSLTHDASFQRVDVHKASYATPKGVELNFRDSYKYNIAAYRLDRLLALNMVPVSIERKLGGETGALTWWVDDVEMMEKERFKKNIRPPDQDAWNDQMFQVRVFNELVYNTDANLGNLLITKDWRLRMVDFSRAFRLTGRLREPQNLVNCRVDRRVFERLRSLDEATLQKELGDVLVPGEIRAILARRDATVSHFGQQIATLGEPRVICDLPGH